tara:strand:- start:693 stop:1208 length:516 start_codon:yes stop_codon:yes gene_type:complete
VTESRTLLNGVDEGIKTIISSKVIGPESPKLVLSSIQNIFPEFNCDIYVEEPEFGKPSNYIFSQENIPLNNFLTLIRKQAILDTALDVLSVNLKDNHTTFQILRQAAIAGKIAFNLTEKNPLGGVIEVELSGDNLESWIEAATWHKGRDTVPRRINDERTMDSDGEASTWH